jgi:hypothetical protein
MYGTSTIRLRASCTGLKATPIHKGTSQGRPKRTARLTGWTHSFSNRRLKSKTQQENGRDTHKDEEYDSQILKGSISNKRD